MNCQLIKNNKRFKKISLEILFDLNRILNRENNFSKINFSVTLEVMP